MPEARLRPPLLTSDYEGNRQRAQRNDHIADRAMHDRKCLSSKRSGLPNRVERQWRARIHMPSCLQAHPPKPERVSDDTDGGQSHRCCSNDRRKQYSEHRIQQPGRDRHA